VFAALPELDPTHKALPDANPQVPWWADFDRRREVFAQMAALGIKSGSPEATKFFQEIETTN